jgi:hypothetical protein
MVRHLSEVDEKIGAICEEDGPTTRYFSDGSQVDCHLFQ